jgi:hypothetical protein
VPQKHTQHSCVAHPMYPELYKCNSCESTFVEFCVDGINLFIENNFIDSLGPGREKKELITVRRICSVQFHPTLCKATPIYGIMFKFWFLMFMETQSNNEN